VSLRDADATHISSDGEVADGRFILYAESQVGRGDEVRAIFALKGAQIRSGSFRRNRNEANTTQELHLAPYHIVR